MAPLESPMILTSLVLFLPEQYKWRYESIHYVWVREIIGLIVNALRLDFTLLFL